MMEKAQKIMKITENEKINRNPNKLTNYFFVIKSIYLAFFF